MDEASEPAAELGRLSTDELMAELRRRARERHPELEADDLAAVEELLARVRARDTLLLDIVSDRRERRLKTFLRFRSHRRFGRLIDFVKRRVLFPLGYWLFEFSRDNFERQQEVNDLLLAAIEILTTDCADLRRRLADLEGPGAPDG